MSESKHGLTRYTGDFKISSSAIEKIWKIVEEELSKKDHQSSDEIVKAMVDNHNQNINDPTFESRRNARTRKAAKKALEDEGVISGGIQHESELARLKFVEERDGKEAMLKFAEQVVEVYIKDAIARSKYKESIDTCINVLKENGISVCVVQAIKIY